MRFFLLGAHYRKPLALSDNNLKAAAVARARLDHFLERLRLVTGDAPVTPAIEERLFLLKKECIPALDDDLNISRALSALFAEWGNSTPTSTGGAWDRPRPPLSCPASRNWMKSWAS